MRIYKIIYPDTSENEYRVDLEINVIVTPPDPNNDVSDWDFYGSTELVDFRIISVQKRVQIEDFTVRQEKDWLSPKKMSYNWKDVQIGDLLTEEREELINEINKEVENECNC